MRGDGSRLDEGRLLLELAVWPMRVVVGDVLAQHPLDVRARDDQDAIEAVGPTNSCVRFCADPRG
jgi:hypothetical protein